MRDCVVNFAADDRLEFNETAEAADLVEVDADIVIKKDLARLLDDDRNAKRRLKQVAQFPRRVIIDKLDEKVVARLRIWMIGAIVGDELRSAAFDLAKLQPATGANEISVALPLDAQPRGGNPFGDGTCVGQIGDTSF